MVSQWHNDTDIIDSIVISLEHGYIMGIYECISITSRLITVLASAEV